MCRSVILLQFFTQKLFRQQAFFQNLQVFDRIHHSILFGDISDHRGQKKPKASIFFPPKFRVSEKFFYSIPVLSKRRTNTRLLGCSSRVVSSENSTFFQKILESKACFFCPNFSGKSVPRRKIRFLDSNSGRQMIGD